MNCGNLPGKHSLLMDLMKGHRMDAVTTFDNEAGPTCWNDLGKGEVCVLLDYVILPSSRREKTSQQRFSF